MVRLLGTNILKIFWGIATFLFVLNSSYSAEIVNYSGRLVQSSGAPVAGSVDLTFKVYSGPSGLTQECEIITTSIPLTNGVFNVELDFETACSGGKLSTVIHNEVGQNIFIEVNDVTNSVTYPKQPLNAVPFALTALTSAPGANSIPFASLKMGAGGDTCVLGGNQYLFVNASGEFICKDIVPGGVTSLIAGAGINVDAATGDVTVSVADNGITTTKILDANVTTAKIADSNVTTAKIADSNVTDAKIVSMNASKLTGTASAIDGSNITNISNTVCTGSDYLAGDGTCITPTDNDTTYTAGSGLDLTTGVFSIDAQGVTNAMLAGIGTNCANGEILKTNGLGSFYCATVDLGTHVATQDIDLATFKLVGNGGTDGIYIANDGKVGIGTTAPTTELSFGGTQPTIAQSTADGSDNAKLKLAGGGSASSSRGAVIVLNGNEEATDAGDLYLAPGATGQIYMNGLVGVGTNNPSSDLHVVDPVSAAVVTIDSLAGNTAQLMFNKSGTNTWHVESDSSDTFSIVESGVSRRLTILQGGNVGIGNTAPTNALDVTGTIQATTDVCVGGTCLTTLAAAGGADDLGDHTATQDLVMGANNITFTTGLVDGVDVSALNTAVTTNTSNITSNDTDIANNASAIATNTANITSNDTDIATNAADIANKENTITAGTTAQYWRGDKSWQTLDTSVVPENTNLYFTDARARTAAVLNSTAGTETDQAASVAAMKTYVTAQTGALTSSQWTTSGSDVYYNTGRVGIGTTSPGTTLDVRGAISNQLRLQKTSTGENSIFYTNSEGWWTLGQDISGAGNFQIYRGGTGTLMTVDSTGNVGIGTTTPASLLDVENSGSDDAVITLVADADNSVGDENDNPFIHMRQDGGLKEAFIGISGDTNLAFNKTVTGAQPNSLVLNSFLDNGSGNVQLATQDTVRLTVDETGKVGVGTTSPTEELEVVGALKSNSRNLDGKIIEKTFDVVFSHGVADQKADIEFAGLFWGDIEVSVTATYANQNAAGTLVKRYSLGLNASNAVYTNEGSYTMVQGATANNFALSDVIWDAAKSKYVIKLVHRVATGNTAKVSIKAFAANGTSYNSIRDSIASAVYTTDTTVYSKPYMEVPDRLAINKSDPTTALDVNGTVTATAFAGDGSALTGISVDPAASITLDGDAAKDLSVGRHPTADTAGNSLGLTAGGATVGATDKNGGNLSLSSGTSTGTGSSSIEFKTASAGAAGTTDNAPTTKMTLTGEGDLALGMSSPVGKLSVKGDDLGTTQGDEVIIQHLEASDGNLSKLQTKLRRHTAGANWFSSHVRLQKRVDNDDMGFIDFGIDGKSADRGLAFGSNTTTHMVIEDSGHVGIGTNSPDYKLHISNNSVIRNDRFENNANGSHVQLSKARGTQAAPTAVQSGDEIFTLWGLAYDGATYQTAARILGVVDGTPGAGDMPGRLDFRTTPDGSTTEQTRMTIKNNGNIGVGTSAPISKFHIHRDGVLPSSSATDSHYGLVVSGTDGSMDLLSRDDNSSVANAFSFGRFNDTTGNLIEKFSIIGYANTGSQGSNTYNRLGFSLGTSAGGWNNTELMSLDRSGNLGIGVTNPSSKLTVNGNIEISPVGTTDYRELKVNRTVSSINEHAFVSVNGITGHSVVGSQNNGISLVANNAGSGVADVYLDANGKMGVGIGNTAPNANFVVKSTNTMGRGAVPATESLAGMSIIGNDDAHWLLFDGNEITQVDNSLYISANDSSSTTYGDIHFATGDSNSPMTERVTIESGGRIHFKTPPTPDGANLRFTTGNSNGDTSNITGMSGNVFLDHVVSATLVADSATTIDTAATVKIDSAPTATDPDITLSYPLALWVESDNSSFGGFVGIGTKSPDVQLSVRQSTGTNDYPTDTSKGAAQFRISNNNQGLEFGSAGVLNARRSWILARHTSSGSYGGYFSTLHIQPDVGTDTNYRGVAIGYDPSVQLNPNETDLAVNGRVEIGQEGLKINSGSHGIGFVGAVPYASAPTGDRVKMYYDSNLYATNQDGLVIEKTDANSNDPDGGISFATRGMDNVRSLVMSIKGNNRVGIGTTAPSETLSVNGTAGKTGGGSWATFSDERLKDVHGDYDKGIAEIMKLNTIRYNYKDDNALDIVNGGEHIGFVAQAVEKVIPEAITYTDDGYLMVNNDPIIMAMLNATQEQQLLIEKNKEMFEFMSTGLETRVNNVERKIASLEEENTSMKQELNKVKSENEILKQYLCSKDPNAPFCSK